MRSKQQQMKKKLTKLIAALAYLTAGQTLDLGNDVFLCGKELDGSNKVYGFTNDGEQLLIITRSSSDGYPISDMDKADIKYIFDLSNIYTNILNKKYRITGVPNDDDFYNKYHPEYNQLLLAKKEYFELGLAADDMCSFGGCMYETFGDELNRVIDMVGINPKRVWTIIECEDTLTIVAGFHYINRYGYLITPEEWTDDNEEYICD